MTAGGASTARPSDTAASAADSRAQEIVDQPRSGPTRRGRLVRRALYVTDACALVAAFLFSQAVAGSDPFADGFPLAGETTLFVLSLPVWIVAARLSGLYKRDDERTSHTTADDLSSVFHLLTAGSWLLFAFVSLSHVAHPPLSQQLSFWLGGIAAVVGGRSVARALLRRHSAYVQNTVIVGAGPIAQLVARKVRQHSEYGLNLIGFVASAPKECRADLGSLELLGEVAELVRIVDRFDIDRVIFSFSNTPSRELVTLVRSLRDRDVRIDIVPRMFEVTGPAVQVHDIEGLSLLALPRSRMSRSAMLVKRTVDVVVAALLLLLAAPLFAWIAWRVRRSSPGPIFFRQSRLGYGGVEFTFLKFRTMKVDVDPAEHEAYSRRALTEQLAPEGSGLFKLDQHDKVTPFGRFLRRTSLDELPQLLNVLRGDMSMVGPRPCIPYETQYFEPYHFERFDVPAGITGLWQVTARAHCPLREALDMDIQYARSWSLGLDLRLLLRTPLQMLRLRTR